MLPKIVSRPRRGRVLRDVVHRLPLLAVLGCATLKEVPVAPSQTVVGSHNTYSVLLMTAGWARSGTKPATEYGADLVLSNAKAGVTVAFNVHRQPEKSIDDVSFERRAALASNNEILGFEEERSFLERSDFVPVSVARYRLRGKRLTGWYPLLVGTARGPDSIVEILAVGTDPVLLQGLFADVLAGLAVPAGAVEAP